MPDVKKSSAAENDLLEIYLYLGREKRSPSAAEKLLSAIEDKCLAYASQPLMGSSRSDLGEGIRVFSCGTKSNPREWVVIYRPIADGIEIVRVFRGKQDYPNLL